MDFDRGDEGSVPGQFSRDTGADPELSPRLLRGECTRVVLLAPTAVLARYLPQALGLLPMSPYQYRITGDLATAAGKLAATDRWIVEGDQWAEFFMPRAQVILSAEIRHTRDKGRSRRWPTSRTDRRAEKSVLDMAFDQQPGWARPVVKSVKLALAEDEYPDKLLRITSWSQVRRLRKVRARKAESAGFESLTDLSWRDG